MVKNTHFGKRKHTMCHKIRQESGFTQKASFYSVVLCFLSHCQANIGRQVRLILPNTYQEIYDTQSCPKNILAILNLKGHCKLITLWGSMHSKKLAGRSFFQNTGLQGWGGISPGGSSRVVPLSHFFMLF